MCVKAENSMVTCKENENNQDLIMICRNYCDIGLFFYSLKYRLLYTLESRVQFYREC